MVKIFMVLRPVLYKKVIYILPDLIAFEKQRELIIL